MDPATRSHVSTKIDASGEIDFAVMKEVVMRHTTLVGATTGPSVVRATPMDIGAIASSNDTEAPQLQQPGGGGEGEWYGEESWQAEEEGSEPWVEGPINGFKGEGKGKGVCYNCGQQ